MLVLAVGEELWVHLQHPLELEGADPHHLARWTRDRPEIDPRWTRDGPEIDPGLGGAGLPATCSSATDAFWHRRIGANLLISRSRFSSRCRSA